MKKIFEEKLLKQLEDEELYKLFKEYQNGNYEARNIIIEHNIRLVLDRIYNKFNNIDYDKEDLVSIGLIGLIKAVDTYDLSKGYVFNTYAVKCIDNEIRMILRKNKKQYNLLSLNYQYNDPNEGDSIELQDFIEEDNDVILNFMNNIENQDLYQAIKNIIDKYSTIDKQIIYMTFGFNGCKIYKQKEIAESLHMSRVWINRKINQILKNIANELYELGYIDKPKKLIKTKK